MNGELITPFLPLGSVLKLKDTIDDTLYYFIVARAIAKNGSGEIVARYKVAPHPVGDIPTQEIFSIEVEQIVEVLFEGFSNETDKEFLDNLLSQMANVSEKINYSELEVMKDAPEVEIEKEPEEKSILKDPFFVFRSN